MATRKCSQGHTWRMEAEAKADGDTCPICGGSGDLPEDAAPDATRVTQVHSVPGSSDPEATGPWDRAGDAAEGPAVPGYEILGVLGRGGMGVVYCARHLELQRSVVALKMILAGTQADREDRERFLAEARVVARMQHPHIVQIHDMGECAGHPYFSLEFIDGGNLAQQLRSATLSAPAAASLVETLARAMDAAHRHGIVHRDLKPANVLLQRRSAANAGLFDPTNYVAKISDFGLAKRMDDDSGLTQSGAIMGTPSYMAPEQAWGEVVGPAADIYALGAILYEGADRPGSVQGRHGAGDARAGGAVPTRCHRVTFSRACRANLETICLKCLHKEPAAAYASAAELADDLHRFLDNRPVLARRPSVWEHTRLWCRRHPGVAALSAALTVALVGGVSLVLHYAFERRTRPAGRMRRPRLPTPMRGEPTARPMRHARRPASPALASTPRTSGSFRPTGKRARPGWWRTLVQGQIPEADDEDLRGFEWYYWNHQLETALHTFRGRQSARDRRRHSRRRPATRVGGGRPDGAHLGRPYRQVAACLARAHGGGAGRRLQPGWPAFATGGHDRTIRVWDPDSGVPGEVAVVPGLDRRSRLLHRRQAHRRRVQ